MNRRRFLWTSGLLAATPFLARGQAAGKSGDSESARRQADGFTRGSIGSRGEGLQPLDGGKIGNTPPMRITDIKTFLVGAGGRNFVDTMLALGSERDEVSVVTDQIGCPTWTGHLAGALVELAERPDETGIHHIAGAGSCSWNEFALEIFERAGVDCRVLPATSEQFVRPARRPAYSVLGTERRDPLVLASWQDGLAAYLATRVTA